MEDYYDIDHDYSSSSEFSDSDGDEPDINIYQIGKEIETTYDCSILDSISITPKLRNEFLTYFRGKEAECILYKPVLARLINNYYDKTKIKPKKFE